MEARPWGVEGPSQTSGGVFPGLQESPKVPEDVKNELGDPGHLGKLPVRIDGICAKLEPGLAARLGS